MCFIDFNKVLAHPDPVTEMIHVCLRPYFVPADKRTR